MVFVIPKTPTFFRGIDLLMVPLMFILGGFKRDSVQETHPWHTWRKFSVNDIDMTKAVQLAGSDSQSFKKHFLFLFHAPIVGGWKNYTVFAPENKTEVFHIGWIVKIDGTIKDFGINKLPIVNGAIRMLDGPPSYAVTFIAFDTEGNQIPLKKIGSGKLGDKSYKRIRLF